MYVGELVYDESDIQGVMFREVHTQEGPYH